MKSQQWHSAIRNYVVIVAGLNFLWEIAQLPFYTILSTGAWGEIAFAVMHCTVGDIFIAIVTLVLGLLVFGTSDWPKQRHIVISLFSVIAGLIYTIYSERMNIARNAWAYSDLMPIIPWLDVGLTPILQWILVPVYGLWKIGNRESLAT